MFRVIHDLIINIIFIYLDIYLDTPEEYTGSFISKVIMGVRPIDRPANPDCFHQYGPWGSGSDVAEEETAQESI